MLKTDPHNGTHSDASLETQWLYLLSVLDKISHR